MYVKLKYCTNKTSIACQVPFKWQPVLMVRLFSSSETESILGSSQAIASYSPVTAFTNPLWPLTAPGFASMAQGVPLCVATCYSTVLTFIARGLVEPEILKGDPTTPPGRASTWAPIRALTALVDPVLLQCNYWLNEWPPKLMGGTLHWLKRKSNFPHKSENS